MLRYTRYEQQYEPQHVPRSTHSVCLRGHTNSESGARVQAQYTHTHTIQARTRKHSQGEEP